MGIILDLLWIDSVFVLFVALVAFRRFSQYENPAMRQRSGTGFWGTSEQCGQQGCNCQR